MEMPRLYFKKGYWRVSPIPIKGRYQRGPSGHYLIKLYILAHEHANKLNEKKSAMDALAKQLQGTKPDAGHPHDLPLQPMASTRE